MGDQLDRRMQDDLRRRVEKRLNSKRDKLARVAMKAMLRAGENHLSVAKLAYSVADKMMIEKGLRDHGS